MRIRRGNWWFVLPALFALAWCPALFGQEKAPVKSKDQAAAQVPPEVSQKAKEYKGSPTPPKGLAKQSDGHWTPYTPPEKPKEGEVYTIVAGDTLSGIAQQKLGTWLLWPQIWDANPYIKDAHWIYPGDPLLIKTPKVVGGEELSMEEEAGRARAGKLLLDEESPMPPVNAHDVYCSGFISPSFGLGALKITSGPNRMRESLSEGDVVYLNGGTAGGVENGSEFFVLAKGQVVHHPETGRPLGNLYSRIGRVKVISAQERSSIAQIVQSCDEIRYGAALVPYRPIPIPWNIEASKELPVYLPDSPKFTGRVVWTADRLESAGRSSIIYTDLGTNQKLAPGDKLWVYRYPTSEDTLVNSITDLYREQKIDVEGRDLYREGKHDEAAALASDTRFPQGTTEVAAASGGSAAAGGDTRLPAGSGAAMAQTASGYKKYLGEAVVITVDANTACLKVLLSAEEIHIGDRVQVE